MKVETSVELEQVLVQFQGPQIVLNYKGKLHSLGQSRETSPDFHAQEIVPIEKGQASGFFVEMVEAGFGRAVERASDAVYPEQGDKGLANEGA